MENTNNDVSILLKLYCLLYADDTILLAEDPVSLQTALNAIENYCDLWSLKINESKTKVMVVSRGKIRNRPLLTYKGTTLEVVDDFSYLGVIFNYNGNYVKAITK